VVRKQKEKQLQEQEEQEEQRIKDALAMHKRDSDKEHKDPTLPWDAFVTDLLRPQRPQRIRHEPARDCYYTAKEAKAGDPLLVNDPAEKTTDSEDNLADS
jgi:hypothetical protein